MKIDTDNLACGFSCAAGRLGAASVPLPQAGGASRLARHTLLSAWVRTGQFVRGVQAAARRPFRCPALSWQPHTVTGSNFEPVAAFDLTPFRAGHFVNGIASRRPFSRIARASKGQAFSWSAHGTGGLFFNPPAAC